MDVLARGIRRVSRKRSSQRSDLANVEGDERTMVLQEEKQGKALVTLPVSGERARSNPNPKPNPKSNPKPNPRKDRSLFSKTMKRGLRIKSQDYLPDDDDVLLDGFMYIRLDRKWKRRWFRIFNDRAEYAKDVRKPPLDSLPITPKFRVTTLVMDNTLMNNRPYNFVLSESRKAFFIAADSQKIKDFWLYVLKKLAEARKNNQELSPQYMVPIALVENRRDSSTVSGNSSTTTSTTRGSKGMQEEEQLDNSSGKPVSALKQMEQAVQELERSERPEPEYQKFDPQDEEEALRELYEGTETETEDDDESRTVKSAETEGNERGSTTEEEFIWSARRSGWSIETESINEAATGEGKGQAQGSRQGYERAKPESFKVVDNEFSFRSSKNVFVGDSEEKEEKESDAEDDEEEMTTTKEPLSREEAYDSTQHLPVLNSFDGAALGKKAKSAGKRRDSKQDEEKSLDLERDDEEALDVHLMGYKEASSMLDSGLDTRPNSLEKRKVLTKQDSLILRSDKPKEGPELELDFGSDSEIDESASSSGKSRKKSKSKLWSKSKSKSKLKAKPKLKRRSEASEQSEQEQERRNSFQLVDDATMKKKSSSRILEKQSTSEERDESKAPKPRRKFSPRARRNTSKSSRVSGLVGMYEERRRKSSIASVSKINAEKEIEDLARAAREKSRAEKRRMQEEKRKEEAEREKEMEREKEREKEREIERKKEEERQREEQRKKERQEFIARLNKVPPPPPPRAPGGASNEKTAGSQGFGTPSKLFEPLEMPKTVASAAPMLRTNPSAKFVSIKMARQLLDSLEEDDDDDDDEEEKQEEEGTGQGDGEGEESAEDRKSRRMINLDQLKRKSLFKGKKTREEESFDAEILNLIGEGDLLGSKSFSTTSAGSARRPSARSEDTQDTEI